MYRKYGSDLCRLCLQKEDELVDIFQRTGRNCPSIAQVIADLFLVVVSSKDQYPKCICRECYSKVMGFYRMKANYPVHTLPTFVLFRNQCKIVNSAVDYAKSYNVETPDLQHSPMSLEHSPFSLDLEGIAAEDELRVKVRNSFQWHDGAISSVLYCYREVVDQLLHTVAQALKNIRSGDNLLDNNSSSLRETEQLALLDREYCVEEDDYSPDGGRVPTSLEAGCSAEGARDVASGDEDVDGNSSPPVCRPPRHYCKGTIKDEGERDPLKIRDQSGNELDREYCVEEDDYSPDDGHVPTSLEAGCSAEGARDVASGNEDVDGNSSPPVRRPPRFYCKGALKDEGERDPLEVRDQSGDETPLREATPDLGRRLRRGRMKRVRYCSEGEEGKGSHQCALCQARFSDNQGLRKHLLEKHVHKDKWLSDCEDSDDSWAPDALSDKGQSASESEMSCLSDELVIEQPGTSTETNSKCNYYRCGVCQKTFDRTEELRRHVSQTHLGRGRRTASLTPASAQQGTPRVPCRKRRKKLCYEALMVDVEGEEGWKRCVACGQRSTGIEDFLEHITLRSSEGELAAGNVLDDTKRSLDASMGGRLSMNVTPGPNGQGRYGLKREPESANEVDDEETGQSAAQGMKYRCPYGPCEKAFGTARGLQVHQTRANHLTSESTLSTPVPNAVDMKYKCCRCPKTCSVFCDLERHVRVAHSEDRPFACHLCGTPFKLRKYLLKHMRRHSNERAFKCDECGRAFHELWSLRLHVSTHTTELTHACAECGKRFGNKMRLNAHLRIHSSRRFQCAECPSSFAVKGDLDKHVVVHTRERRFECPTCHKWFLHSRNRNQHIRQVHLQETAKRRSVGPKKRPHDGDDPLTSCSD
ncbi:zinc finger protein 467-like isoform X3 [Ischnura elegans]|uniref:zinc finger protein 467-like isoform X3 n=1 Tax=Ischnura elegans TaxID=197161 RepID=UPI001ED8BCA5|nr:zinc finger protein 467-like isoform X3 [Ischnura elegans]